MENNNEIKMLDYLKTEHIVSLTNLISLDKQTIENKEVIIIDIKHKEMNNPIIVIGDDIIFNVEEEDGITYMKHSDSVSVLSIYRDNKCIFLKELKYKFVIINNRLKDQSNLITFDIVDSASEILTGDYDAISKYPLYEKEIKTIINNEKVYKTGTIYTKLSPLVNRINILNLIYDGTASDILIINDLASYDDAIYSITPYLLNRAENKYLYLNDILYTILSYEEGKIALRRISNGSESTISIMNIANSSVASIFDSKTTIIDRCGDVYKDGTKINKTVYTYLPLITENLSDDSKISKLYKLIDNINDIYNTVISKNDDVDENTIDLCRLGLEKIVEYKNLYNMLIQYIDTKIPDDEYLFIDLCKYKLLIDKNLIKKVYENIVVIEEELTIKIPSEASYDEDTSTKIIEVEYEESDEK